MRLFVTVSSFVVLALLLIPGCGAQDVYNEINVGTPPNGLLHGGEIDNVQTGNGNLHIEIPIWTVRGRGPLASGAVFALDTKEWTAKFTTSKSTGLVNASIQPEIQGTLGGKVSGLTAFQWSQTVHAGTPACWSTGGYVSNYVVREPNGTKHHLIPDPGDGCPPVQHWSRYYADDGSAFAFFYGPSSYTKNGILLGSTPTDTNGNKIVSGQDTLGRTVPNGNLTYYDNAGNAQTIQISYTSVPLNTHLCQLYDGWDTCTERTGSISEVSQIRLANGMTYTINYVQNDMGEPSSVTLPSGAQISWTYNTGDKGGPWVKTRTVTANGQTNTWSYNFAGGVCASCVTSIIDPLGNETDLTYTQFTPYPGNSTYNYNAFPFPSVTTKQFKDKSSGSLVLAKTETTDYSNSIGPVLPIRITTTWNQSNLVSKVETDYDSFAITGTTIFASASNPLAKREYDWGSGASGTLVRRTAFNYLHLSNSTYLSANILDRVTGSTVYDSTNNTCAGVSQPCAQTTYSYDSTAITNTSNTPAPNHDYTGHGYTFTVRGNLTQTSRWLNSSGTWLNTTNIYDDLGNLRSTTDPLGNVTSLSYVDNFTDGVNRNAQAFITQITRPVTSGVNHIEKKQFFWYTSLVAASCGQNFPSASACANTYSPPQPDYFKLTYDNMFRPLTISRGDGGSTTASYNDLTLPLSVTANSSITSSMSKTTIGLFDDFYRLKQTQLTSDQQGTVFTETTYDLLGRKSTITNPHRAASAPTDGTTTFYYDAFDRACLVVPPDGMQPTGSSCPSTRPTGDVLTSYSGNTVTVTDQAGKSRKSVSDGLGRLTQVFEDPTGLNYETDYQYNALDNLTRDDQKGGDGNSGNWRTRTFAYDSLSRLLCAANPEIQIVMCPNPDNGSYIAGTTRYTYDSDGNVLTKKSPKPNQTSASVSVTATFAYDALNRIKNKSFDNGDPTINYAYDAVTPTGCTPGSFSYGNAVGKRTAMCDAAGMELWGYSITSGIGWLTTDQRTTNSVTKTTSYQNNFGGMLASLTYPSGRVITFTPDGAGRTSKAIDVPNSISYVTGTCANGTDNLGACYTPPGSLSSVSNGPNLVSTFYYNSRLQPCRISVKSSGTAPASCMDTALGNVLDFTYNFSLGSSDNGNVAAITNNRDTTRSQSFTYDALNRLFTAKTASTSGTKCWDEQFGYDPWANLLTISRISGYTCSNEELLNVAATTKNQISGYTYDAAGNLINDGLGHAYTFSAENHLLTAGGVTYTYDGDGKRAKKSNGKLYWYGMGSDPLTETDTVGTPSSEYISFGGKRTARIDLPSAAVHYYFSDHLGSANVVTSSAGVIQDESDYYPFGGERAITNSDPNNYKFTGKERDSESGLDNFGARYFGSSLGRFTTPDAPFADQHSGNPQTWNLYAYGRNNPLGGIDTNGREYLCVTCVVQAVKNWWNGGVARDGGTGNFAKNNAIGAGKGTGTFALNTIKTVVAASEGAHGNIPGALATITAPSPTALRPSNQTQAQASTATQVTLAVASVVVPGAIEGAAAPATTSLFRAVGTAEAESIEATGAFSGAPNGTMFKGFFFEQADAESFGQAATEAFGEETSVYSTEAPTDLVNASPPHSAAGEGPGTLIQKENLNQLSPPTKVKPK